MNLLDESIREETVDENAGKMYILISSSSKFSVNRVYNNLCSTSFN